MKKKKHPAQVFSPKRLKKNLMGLIFVLICSLAFWVQDQHHEIKIPVDGKPVELYANQVDDNLTEIFRQAIDQAQKSILLIVYSFTDNKIINALKKQSQKGIDVKVICDAKASPYIDSKLGDKIAVVRRFGPGLMHQKILVIDKEKVWLGSANMTPDSLRMHGNLVTGIHNEKLAGCIHAKAETLKFEGRSTHFPQENFWTGGQQTELWFLPDNQKAVPHLTSLIESARKTIRIAMFTWTRQDLAKAVIQAANKGIDVQVVIDRSSGKGASANIFSLLKKNGVPVFLSSGAPLLHHKFLYIDGKTLVNGSANWTKAAFTQNDDCFLVIHNLTEEQKKQMEALWNVVWQESE